MSVFVIQDQGLVRLYDIHHRYEFSVLPGNPGNPRIAMVDQPGGIELARLIFPDSADADIAEIRQGWEWPWGQAKAAR